MTEFAIERYGSDDWRLLKWDGSSETEIGSGWPFKPTFEDCLRTLMDHHATGNQPFSSRDGAVDAHLLSSDWPLPTRDMTLTDETMPWDDTDT
jgi:hypothetical protein